MKSKRTHPNLLVPLALAVVVGCGQALAQQTTAFTYQGQLRDGGTNANGTYSMTFKLYDALSGGSQIGSDVTTSPTLANGLFSVNLDFGAGAFNGSGRWLDITVAGDTLTPRVQVLSTPYALFASVAATVTNGAITSQQLAYSAVNGTNIASGQVVKNFNGLTDNVMLSAGANTAMFTNGSALQISAGVPNIQAFLSSGTFLVPTNVAKIMVEMWGGGGGGGAYFCQNVTNGGVITQVCSPGGGGGAGAYAFNVFSVTPGASYTVTAASGGTGGSGNGSAGGTVSFGNLMSAGGGSGGGLGGVNHGSGGVGGTASGGVIFITGGDGKSGSGNSIGGGIWRGGSGISNGPGGGGSGGTGEGAPGSDGKLGIVIVSY